MGLPSRAVHSSSRKRCMILPALLLIPGLLLFQVILREHILVSNHHHHGSTSESSHVHDNAVINTAVVATAAVVQHEHHGHHGHAHSSSLEENVKKGTLEGSIFGGGGGGVATLLRSLGVVGAAREDLLPPPQRPSSRPSPRPGTLDDPDPIHVVYTLCGNPNEIEKDHYGLLGVKSLLMAKADNAGSLRHYVFHILTNVGEEELFNTTFLNWEVYRAMQKEARAGLISFHIYNIKELDQSVKDAIGDGVNPNLMVPHHIFKNCAASRLKLPFLLGGIVDRIIYLDWDSVCMCDLTRLWDEWKRFSLTATLGFAHADPSQASERDTYRVWDQPRHPTLGSINSGVMLMHIGRLHADGRAGTRAFWTSAAGILRSRANITGGPQDYWELTKAFPLGDQDLLNALFAAKTSAAPYGHPEWLHIIPPQYNFCIDPPWLEDLQEVEHIPIQGYKGPARPCVIHFCGNRIMTNTKGEEYLPVTDAVQASFMYIKYWQIERRENPPGMRDPTE
jgi:hypothetical protein